MSTVDIVINKFPGLESLKDSIKLPGFKKSGPDVPSINPEYIFRKEQVLEVIGYFTARESLGETGGLLLYGEPGCGKSICIRQLAAYLKRPLFSSIGGEDVLFNDFVGRANVIPLSDKQGNYAGSKITFQLGPLARAMKTPYSIFLVEEFDRLSPQESVSFNSVLDGYSLDINDNCLSVKPAKGFSIVATANGNAQGSQSGICATSNVLDSSTVSRMWSVYVEYPTIEEEMAILKKVLKRPDNGKQLIPDEALKLSLNMAQSLRDAANSADGLRLPAPFDIRAILRFWRTLTVFKNGHNGLSPVMYAMEKSYTSKFCTPGVVEVSGVRAAIEEIVKSSGLDDFLPGTQA